MEVGISATRKGLTLEQRAAIARLFRRVKDFNPTKECWLNHGDCIGGDRDIHEIAREIGYKIRVHPPENASQRAWCDYDEIMPVQTYSVRNGNIVRASDLVIAAPSSKNEIPRGSGTWQVIRIARKIRPKKPYVIVYPDGEQVGNNNWQQFIH